MNYPYSSNIRTLVIAAMFIALTVIFTNVFAIQTPFVRISFSFLPIAIFSMIFGPLKGGIVAAIADVSGCLLFNPGLFFPGFTLSSFLSGFIYGYCLYGKNITLQRITITNLIIVLLIDLILNTLWLSILYHKAALVFFWGRVVKCSILLPIQITLIYAIYKPLRRLRKANLIRKN